MKYLILAIVLASTTSGAIHGRYHHGGAHDSTENSSENLEKIFNITNVLVNNTLLESLNIFFNREEEKSDITTVQPGSEEKPEVTKVQPTEKPIDTEINEEVSRFEIPIKINSTHLELFPDFLQNNTLWDKFSNNTILNQLYNLFGTTDVEATPEVTMVQPESKHDLITEESIEKPIDSESNEEIVRLAIPININSTHLELFPNFLQNNTLWDKFSNNTILTQLYTLFGQVEKTSEDEESFTVDDDQPEEQEESLRLSFPNIINSTHIEYIEIFPNYLVNTTLWNRVTNSTLWNTFTNLFSDTLTNLVEEAPEVTIEVEETEEITTESITTFETTESPEVKETTKTLTLIPGK